MGKLLMQLVACAIALTASMSAQSAEDVGELHSQAMAAISAAT